MKTSFRAVVVSAALAALGLTGCEKEMSQAEVHRRAGHALVKESKFLEAAEAYELSLQADPKQEKVWEQKAFALLKGGKSDEACQALLKTVDFKADDAGKIEVYRNVAGMYLKSTTPEKSEQYFNEVLKLAPKDEQALTWLGELYSTLGGARSNDATPVPEQLQKAIGFYDQAIAVNPDSVTAYVNKRIALTKMGMYHQKAIADAQQTALDNKKDKTIVAETQVQIADHTAKIDALKLELEATTAKLSDAMKRQKAAGAAPAAAK